MDKMGERNPKRVERRITYAEAVREAQIRNNVTRIQAKKGNDKIYVDKKELINSTVEVKKKNQI